ncbi:hypothetical protein ACEUZ9_000918 [Paracoccus litorisediminis]|uniref:hypothetical protein n=1 Tax=Paracoccus litorisediminis TaxID=2006130 RepID=UPI00372DEF66
MNAAHDYRNGVAVPPAQMRRADILEFPYISLVSPISETAWTGFSSVREAIAFKHDHGLAEAWRIRDRRPDGHHDAYGDALLVLGSMISDHIRPFAAAMGGIEDLAIDVRREIIAFSLSVLHEAGILSPCEIGTWRAMRGKYRNHFGKERAHAWLEDLDGNVLDILPWNASVSGPVFHAAGKESSAFLGYSPLNRVYGTVTDSVLRGAVDDQRCALRKEEILARYDFLTTHIQAFLKRAPLPQKKEES